MAIMLEGYTTEKQNSVAHFLLPKGLNAKNIHKKNFPVYGGKGLSRKAVHNCFEKLSQGHSKVADDTLLRL
jgi:hypothetical protein